MQSMAKNHAFKKKVQINHIFILLAAKKKSNMHLKKLAMKSMRFCSFHWNNCIVTKPVKKNAILKKSVPKMWLFGRNNGVLTQPIKKNPCMQ